MKKILIISYYWPPNAGVGARRWLNFQKHLSSEYSITVYTPENPNIFNEDVGLLNNVSSNTKIIKQKIWEPYNFYKKFTNKTKVNPAVLIDSKRGGKAKFINWVRANFFIPDAKCFWIEKSVSYLSKVFKKEDFDYVISSGPPHSMHLIALNLRERFMFKWVADFRDPWTNMEYFDRIPLWNDSKKKHFYFQKKVIKNADLILTVSNSWSDDFKKIGALNSKVIYNGFEKISSKNSFHDKFRIGHFGLFNELRDHNDLWKSLNQITEKNKKFKDDLEIFFSGPTHKNFHNNLKNHGLLSQLNYFEWNPLEKMNQEMLKCSLLIISQSNTIDAMGRVPAKFFEYLGTGIPIIAIGKKGSDLSKLISKYKCGVFFEFNHLNKLSNHFLMYYENYLKKKKNINKMNVDFFSWKNQASNLVDLLENL